MKKYFSIHNHTHYSNIRLLDCIIKPANLIKYAMELGLSGVCITDHECLSASMEVNKIYKELIDNGSDFKIGIGNEIYLVDERVPQKKYYHFILIAKDAIGHNQLRILSSKAWYGMFNSRKMDRVPTLKSELEEVVKNNPGHLIATTACLGGELSQKVLELILAENKKDVQTANFFHNQIIDFMLFMKDLFKDDFYIECAPNDTSEEQIMVNKRLKSVAKAFGVKMVYATDSHYLKKSDRFIHEAFLNSKEGEREVASFYNSSYMMSQEEVVEKLKICFDEDFINEMTSNSLEIMNKIEFYDLRKKQQVMRLPVNIPNVDCIKNKIDEIKEYNILYSLFNSKDEQEEFWCKKCLVELNNKNLWKKEYLERLEIEADVIKFVGEDFGTCLFAYFNNLNHYINYVWEVGSIVGPGRGSATCYLSNYLLGITQLDPIYEKLPYWRSK